MKRKWQISFWVRVSEAAEFHSPFPDPYTKDTSWNSHQIVYLDTLGLLLNGYMYRQYSRPALPALTSLKQFK